MVRLALFFVPVVEAVLREPVLDAETGQQLSHFARSYYVWARDNTDAANLARFDVEEEGSFQQAEPPVARAVDDVPASVRSVVMLDTGRGVCWRSGRAFYNPEAD
jgi:hypothetical protein